MAISITTMSTSIGADVVYDTGVGLTAVENIVGGSGTWYTICAKNTDSATAYLKLFDAKTCVPGTDHPNWVLQCKGSDTSIWTVPDGVTFPTGLSYFASEEQGITATTAPSALSMWIVIKKD